MVQTYYDPLIAGTHDLQELANTYFQITLARMRLQHSLLLHYIPLYFPEFARYWNSTRSEWFIRFLLRFPAAGSIRALDFEAFSREALDLIGRKVAKRTWLAETYAMAAESIGLPVSLESTAIAMFRLQLSLQLNMERKQLDETAQRLLAEDADFRRLVTLPWPRSDYGAYDSSRSRRPAALWSSPSVPQLLRPRSLQNPVGAKSRARNPV